MVNYIRMMRCARRVGCVIVVQCVRMVGSDGNMCLDDRVLLLS